MDTKTVGINNSSIKEQARFLMVSNRKRSHNRQATMLERSTNELKIQ